MNDQKGFFQFSAILLCYLSSSKVLFVFLLWHFSLVFFYYSISRRLLSSIYSFSFSSLSFYFLYLFCCPSHFAPLTTVRITVYFLCSFFFLIIYFIIPFFLPTFISFGSSILFFIIYLIILLPFSDFSEFCSVLFSGFSMCVGSIML